MAYVDNIINNTVSSGLINPVRTKKLKNKDIKKTKGSGVDFVAKLREEIETELRAEYEARLSETVKNMQNSSSVAILSREDYIAQQHDKITKQYNHLLSLCNNYPEAQKLLTVLSFAKRLYE